MVLGENESDWVMTNLEKISRDELNSMMESNQEFYVYFGRPSCLDCLEFYPKFKKILAQSKETIYYYSTEAKASEKADMLDFVKLFGIKEVPSILYSKDNTVEKVYDGQNEDDLQNFSCAIKE